MGPEGKILAAKPLGSFRVQAHSNKRVRHYK